MNYDIVLVSMPVMETTIPPPGIYYLKGELEKNGFKTRCFNLVRDYAEHFKSISEEKNIQAQIHLLKAGGTITSRFTDANSNKLNQTLKDSLEHYDDALDNEINDYFDYYIENKIKPCNPRYVGLSIFSRNSTLSGQIMCSRIRTLMPDVKIILGGMGVMSSMTGSSGYGNDMLEEGMADYYITGEGEIALVELLKGNKEYPGINGSHYKQIDDLDSLAKPDYSDYASDYGSEQQSKLVFYRATLTGSRGCVRSCSFCDIGAFWKKYRYRSGKSIAEEMIKLNTDYGVKQVGFSDSLINGSMKAFRDLCTNMADYHQNTVPLTKNPEDSIICWGGQFIARSEQQASSKDYQLMRDANLSYVAIGIESASETVRNHMKKGFTNKDMYFSIDQLIENGIKVDLMFIVGYPTETLEDFEENIKFFEYYADRIIPLNTPMADRIGGIFNVNLGETMSIPEGTAVMLGEGNLWKLKFGTDVYPHTWESTVVPGLDYGERVRRRRILSECINDLGYYSQWNKQQLANLEKKHESYEKRLAYERGLYKK